MAKKGVKYRNVKRTRMVANDAAKRAELKAIIINEKLDFSERMTARDTLNKMRVNGSAVRLVNRCVLTGRPHGVYRKFKICRNKFREMASAGQLPGVTKSSW